MLRGILPMGHMVNITAKKHIMTQINEVMMAIIHMQLCEG